MPEATDRALGSLEIQAYDKLCLPELAAQQANLADRRPFVGALTLELATDADDEVLSRIAADLLRLWQHEGHISD